MSGQATQPSPELIFDTLNAYQKTAAMKAAIELGLFTAIAEGNKTSKDIATKCRAAERGTRILCDYLVVNGFLTKTWDKYGLSPDSAIFLDRNSPAYLGGISEFILSPMLTAGFNDLAAAVRKGGTVISEGGTVAPENPVWVKFARAMVPMMALPAQFIANYLSNSDKIKVLDIAAGHGMFGITIARHNPNATIIALDWPAVLEVARENADAAGVADRFSVMKGSAFDVDYGSGYDVILLTNFLHHFDVPTCETLLRKVHAALADGGKAVTLEFVPNSDRVSPPVAASFSLMMLGSTPTGDAYTFAELESMFKNAGYSG
ncbi:MAG: methyltransferase, partial [Pyrinomonadaceae bacterium]